MKKSLIAMALTSAALAPAWAADIVDTAVKAGSFKTLATALQAAGLVDTLKGPGPFTVFAPTDEAFAKIPKADLDALLMDKSKLTAVLTYHVVAGTMDSKAIAKAIKAGRGKARLTTVQGETLTAAMMGKRLMLTDAKGGMSMVSMADVKQSNGVVHVIDTVVMP